MRVSLTTNIQPTPTKKKIDLVQGTSKTTAILIFDIICFFKVESTLDFTIHVLTH